MTTKQKKIVKASPIIKGFNLFCRECNEQLKSNHSFFKENKPYSCSCGNWMYNDIYQNYQLITNNYEN